MSYSTKTGKRKTFLSWIGIIALIVSVGFTACWQLWQQRFQQEWELGTILARQVSQSMNMWLNNQVDIARTLADSPLIQQAAASPGDAMARKNASDYLNRFHASHPEYTLITVIPFFNDPEAFSVMGPDGSTRLVRNAHSLIDSVGGASIGTGGLSFNYIKAIYDGAPSFLSEAKENAVEGFPSLFMIAVPIFDHNGHKVGALGIGVKLEYFSIFFSDQVRTGQTGNLDIIDDRGLYVSHSNRTCLLNPKSISSTKSLLENLRQGITQFLREDEGVNWLYSISPVNTEHETVTQWWVLFRQDRNEIIQALIWPIIGLGVLCMLVSGLLILLLFRASLAMERSRQAKEVVRQMEAYRLYTRSVPYGILMVDGSGTFLDINPATTSLWGYTADELLGQPLHRTTTQETQDLDWNGLPCTIRELAEASTLRDVSVRLRDGSSALFDLTADYLQEGHTAGCYVVTLAAVPETRDLEAQMEAVYRTSFDYYIIFDKDANILDCTDSCVTLLGASSRQEVQDDFLSFSPAIQPDGRPSVIGDHALIESALRDGFYKAEWMHQTKNGDLVPCEVSLVRFMLKGQPAVTACLRDLREQKRHEAILARERTILRTVIDGMQNYLFLRDEDGRYLVVNRRFCEVMGVSAGDVLGKTMQEVLAPSILEPALILDDIACNNKGAYVYEQNLTLPDGTQRDYLISREVIRDESDGIIGIMGVGVDVSRLKEAERQIAIAKNLADAASQAKSDFLARMSHEIRTPMNAILGMTYICLRNEMPETQRSQLCKIQNAAEHLMEILNSILDFSKIESGKMETEEIAFSLHDLLDQVNSLFLYKAQASGVDLEIAIAPETPLFLLGDPLHLRQILINLGSNALKFTREGKIRFSIMPTTVLENRVRLNFSISDTGIGMSTDQINVLFQPFTQANGSITRLYGGTGLGLAITKSLVDMLGGQISVESELEKGTTFHVSLWFGMQLDNPDSRLTLQQEMLPLRPVSSETEDAPFHVSGTRPDPASDLWQAPPCSVLLVEDDSINQEIAIELLKLSGITPQIANNGEEAIAAYCRTLDNAAPYDLILMDIQMPLMDGLEACRHIRNTEKMRHVSAVPIVAMTAHALISDRQLCMDAGMNGHLAKPIDPAKLNQCLKLWLKKH